MIKSQMKSTLFGLAACLVFGLSGAAAADDLVEARQLGGTKIGFLVKSPYRFATLTVSGPNDFNASAFSKSGAVAVDLRQSGPVEDGAYSYQLTAATETKAKTRLSLDNGRDRRAQTEPLVGASVQGTFNVVNGAIVAPNDRAPATRNDQDAK